MGHIKPRRYEQYDLWDPLNQSVPRFTIMIIDSNEISGISLQLLLVFTLALILIYYTGHQRTCAVFFIPRGREFEFTFASEQGLRDIMAQAGCKRLFAVRCNRPHEFGSDQVSLINFFLLI